MRRYGEDIEVRPGLIAGEEGPAQFLWRGRVWVVRALLSSWVTSTPWWRGAEAARVLGSEALVSELPGHELPGSDGPGGVGREHGDVATVTRTHSGAQAESAEELQVWRVEAGRGGGYRTGVFDVSRSTTTGQWRLETCLD